MRTAASPSVSPNRTFSLSATGLGLIATAPSSPEGPVPPATVAYIEKLTVAPARSDAVTVTRLVPLARGISLSTSPATSVATISSFTLVAE